MFSLLISFVAITSSIKVLKATTDDELTQNFVQTFSAKHMKSPAHVLWEHNTLVRMNQLESVVDITKIPTSMLQFKDSKIKTYANIELFSDIYSGAISCEEYVAFTYGFQLDYCFPFTDGTSYAIVSDLKNKVLIQLDYANNYCSGTPYHATNLFKLAGSNGDGACGFSERITFVNSVPSTEEGIAMLFSISDEHCAMDNHYYAYQVFNNKQCYDYFSFDTTTCLSSGTIQLHSYPENTFCGGIANETRSIASGMCFDSVYFKTHDGVFIDEMQNPHYSYTTNVSESTISYVCV